jgi:hypothetical protein
MTVTNGPGSSPSCVIAVVLIQRVALHSRQAGDA